MGPDWVRVTCTLPTHPAHTILPTMPPSSRGKQDSQANTLSDVITAEEYVRIMAYLTKKLASESGLAAQKTASLRSQVAHMFQCCFRSDTLRSLNICDMLKPGVRGGVGPAECKEFLEVLHGGKANSSGKLHSVWVTDWHHTVLVCKNCDHNVAPLQGCLRRRGWHGTWTPFCVGWDTWLSTSSTDSAWARSSSPCLPTTTGSLGGYLGYVQGTTL